MLNKTPSTTPAKTNGKRVATVSHLRAFVDGVDGFFSQLPPFVSDGVDGVEAWNEVHVGDGVLAAYGWLNDTAWSHAHGKLRFELVRSQSLLVRELADESAELPGEIEILDAFDEQARWLFDRCAGDFGAAVVRDDRYLNRRFVDDANQEYLRLGARDAEGILRGYAILRFESSPLARPDWRRCASAGAFLVDWLVPPTEPEVGELLARAAVAAAATRAAPNLALVMPEWSPWSLTFQDWGWFVEPSERLVAVRSSVPKYDMYWLRDHWWYQAAESHLV